MAKDKKDKQEFDPVAMTETLAKIVEKAGNRNLDTAQALKEYDPMQHDVFDETIRKKKEVTKEGTTIDPKTSKPVKITTLEEVNRIAIPLQRIITVRRTAFINAGQMMITAKPNISKKGDPLTHQERLLAILNKTREDNKMQYKETEIVRRVQTELQAAKLWYAEDVDQSFWGDLVGKVKDKAIGGNKRLRCKILSPELGDELFPIFNSYGKLVYFARAYKAKPDFLENPDAKDEEIRHLEMFSDTYVWRFTNVSDAWVINEKDGIIKHGFKKIPVIYYEEAKTPWADVQPMISRLETVLSNFADTTDYNGAPILAATGTIVGMAERGERGKTFQLKEGAKLEYVTWDQAPEAIKLEIDTLVDFIYTCTQTPDISTKGMSGLGVKSGTGIDRVFLDPQLAATNFIAGGYGESTQRDLNFLKSAIIHLIDTTFIGTDAEDLAIPFEIPVFKINDKKDSVDIAKTAYEAGLGSLESMVAETGLFDDPIEEVERIRSEKLLNEGSAKKEEELV